MDEWFADSPATESCAFQVEVDDLRQDLSAGLREKLVGDERDDGDEADRALTMPASCAARDELPISRAEYEASSGPRRRRHGPRRGRPIAPKRTAATAPRKALGDSSLLDVPTAGDDEECRNRSTGTPKGRRPARTRTAVRMGDDEEPV
jgi:hypothetical protein